MNKYICSIKKLISIWLLGLFVSNIFILTIIQLNYEINKERITELFCVNKDKPMTMCYGKCYLKKQMDNVQDEKEESSLQIHQLPIMAIPNNEVKTIFFAKVPEVNFSDYLNFYTYLLVKDIFDPPRTI